MDPKRVLVVYYSRTGRTRTVARAIQDELGCEVDRIADKKRRGGVLGYVAAVVDAMLARPTALHPMTTDPLDYDLVVVGTPIWNASVALPVRAWLEANRDRIQHAAFFCTHGGSGSARAIRQMEALTGQPSIATLSLRSEEVRRGAFAAKVRTFASALHGSSTSPRTAPPSTRRPVPA
jgi:flavodoxin